MTLKRVGVFILGLMFVSVLFAVPANSATVRVTMRTLPATAGQKFLKKAIKRFRKKTGIRVKLELVSSGVVRRRLITTAETQAGSDIVIAQFNGAVTIKNALVNVDDIVEPYAKKYGLLPLFRDAGFIDGHWKATPFVNVSQMMTYRKDIL
jgi:ABC-type glycerol-3-phosphate transport system substrate-binding protein